MDSFEKILRLTKNYFNDMDDAFADMDNSVIILFCILLSVLTFCTVVLIILNFKRKKDLLLHGESVMLAQQKALLIDEVDLLIKKKGRKPECIQCSENVLTNWRNNAEFNYILSSLEMNIHKMILEKNYYIPISKMYMVQFHPDIANFNFIPIPVLYKTTRELFYFSKQQSTTKRFYA